MAANEKAARLLLYGPPASMGADSVPMALAWKYLECIENDIDMRWARALRKDTRADPMVGLLDASTANARNVHKWSREQIGHIHKRFRDYVDKAVRQISGCMDLANGALTHLLAAKGTALRVSFAGAPPPRLCAHGDALRARCVSDIPGVLSAFRDACEHMNTVCNNMVHDMAWDASHSAQHVADWLESASGVHAALTSMAVVAVGAWAGATDAHLIENVIEHAFSNTTAGDLMPDARVHLDLHSVVASVLNEAPSSNAGAPAQAQGVIEHPITRSVASMDEMSRRKLAEDVWLGATGCYTPRARLATGVMRHVSTMLLKNFAAYVPLQPVYVARPVGDDSAEYVKFSPADEIQTMSRARDNLCHLMLADRMGKRLLNILAARALLVMYGLCSTGNEVSGVAPKVRPTPSYEHAALYLFCEQLCCHHDLSLLRPEMHAILSTEFSAACMAHIPIYAILCTRPAIEPVVFPANPFPQDTIRAEQTRAQEAALAVSLIVEIGNANATEHIQTIVQRVVGRVADVPVHPPPRTQPPTHTSDDADVMRKLNASCSVPSHVAAPAPTSIDVLPSIDEWLTAGTAYAERVPLRVLLLAHVMLYVADRLERMLGGADGTQIPAKARNSRFARTCLLLQYTQTRALTSTHFGKDVAGMSAPVSMHTPERVWFALMLVYQLYVRADASGRMRFDASAIVSDFRNIKIDKPLLWGTPTWTALSD